MEFTRKSVWSGKTRTLDLPVTQEQYDIWKSGKGKGSYIQNAMSNLTDNEREFILTGIYSDNECDEWAEMCGEPDEDYIVCKFCDNEIDPATAHLHQGEWIGDECCWDERLKSSE